MERLDTDARTFDEDVPTPDRTDTACPECAGAVTTSDIETVCVDCGLVVNEDRLDRGPEWRCFDDDERTPERTGAPLTASRHDRGLSTEIGRGEDANGNAISRARKRRMNRLRREHSRARFESKRERNQALGMTEIRRLCGALELGDGLRDQACQLFRTAQKGDLLHGRSIEAMASAALYVTLRCNRAARPLEAVSALVPVAHDRVLNAYRVLNRELELPVPPTRPVNHVPRIVSKLELGRDVEREARRLAERVLKAGVANGRNPAGVAAGCVYAAAGGHAAPVTQAAVGDVAGVTAPTVRARWKELNTL
jgi:transcription initiation factor TFIIB